MVLDALGEDYQENGPKVEGESKLDKLVEDEYAKREF